MTGATETLQPQPLDRARTHRSTLPPAARRKLERLERSALAARAVVVDLASRIDTERERLRGLERERVGWNSDRSVLRLSTADIERQQRAEAEAAAEVQRLEHERAVLEQRAQTLGAVAETARRHLGVE